MQRVLVITHSYSPTISPRAFRWSAIAEYWVKQGHHIDVVSSWKPGLPQYEIVNGVHVYRVGGAISEVLRSRLQKPAMTPTVETNKSNSVSANTKTLAKWIHDHTWKKVYWPDCACLWYFPTLKKAKQLLASHHYDNVITVSEPFTGHLVGLSIKQVLPSITWLVDIGDPFCFIEYRPTNNHKLYKNLNYAIERKIFREANAISVTTEATSAKYADLFSESAAKIHVISPVWSLDKSPVNQESFFPSRDRNLRLLFVGTLHKEIRKPDMLLRLFNELLRTHLAEKLELHFVGNINNCHEYFQAYKTLLNKKIFCHGKLSRSQAFQAMKEADVLVNIGNEFPYQLPSKVVEYASLGKPVLNLAKIDEDSSAAFFKHYPGSLCLLEDDGEVNSDQFTKLIQFLEKLPSVNSSQLTSLLEPFRIESIAEDYKALL